MLSPTQVFSSSKNVAFSPFYQVHGQTHDVEIERRTKCDWNLARLWSLHERCHRWNCWRMPRRNQKQHRNGGMSTFCSEHLKQSSMLWTSFPFKSHSFNENQISTQYSCSQFAGHSWKFNCDGRRTGEGMMATNDYPDLIRHTMKDFDIQNQLK